MHTGHTLISFTSRKSIKVWGLETGANLSGARYFCYFFVKNIRTIIFGAAPEVVTVLSEVVTRS